MTLLDLDAAITISIIARRPSPHLSCLCDVLRV